MRELRNLSSQNGKWISFDKTATGLPQFHATSLADGPRNLAMFPPSLRKLEWNCKGEERDLWHHVLQFRPSGLRAKRYTSSPALVAMTTTQIPILGPKRRFLDSALRAQASGVSRLTSAACVQGSGVRCARELSARWRRKSSSQGNYCLHPDEKAAS